MASGDPNFHHNQTTLKSLRRGDLVQFGRGVYSHWAVYIVDEIIVHLAGEEDDGINAPLRFEHVFTICGVQFNKAKVCKDNYWNVVLKNKAYKNNERDKSWKPYDAERIVHNALGKLGEVGYSLIFKNCEHFAKWCRYGEEKSDQVETFFTGLAVVAAGALTAGVVHAIAKVWKNNEEEEEEDQNQRSKAGKSHHRPMIG